MTPPTLAITAWPAAPLPLPRYARHHYTLSEERELPRLIGEPTGESSVASGETCLSLVEVDLGDTSRILAFANEVGIIGFGGGPDEQSIAEFELGATVVSDAVTAWRVLMGERGTNGNGWRLPRLWKASDESATAVAAAYLNDVLGSGLESFRPTIAVAVGDEEPEPVLDLNLHTLCCLELFNHVAAGDAFARCANESCGRLFVLDDRARRRGVRYCSRQCARAQAQREFRRRRAQADVTSG